MPSYRIVLGIGLLHPGVDPESVLPAAAGAARARTTVESWDVGVVHGQARVTVRFTAPDDEHAVSVGQDVHAAVQTLAQVRLPGLTRRHGARWDPVR